MVAWTGLEGISVRPQPDGLARVCCAGIARQLISRKRPKLYPNGASTFVAFRKDSGSLRSGSGGARRSPLRTSLDLRIPCSAGI